MVTASHAAPDAGKGLLVFPKHVARVLTGDRALRRVLNNSAWLLSSNSVGLALSFLQGILIARMLGAESFGAFALITSFTTALNQFADSRVWETAIKFVTKFLQQGEARRATAVAKLCYLVDAATAFVAFVVVLLAAEWAAAVFVKDVAAGRLIQFYALTLLIQAPLGTSSALLRVADRFAWLAYQQTFLSAVRLAGAIAVFAAGGGLLSLLAMYLVTSVLATVVMLSMSFRVMTALGFARFSDAPLSVLRGEFRELLPFLGTTNLYGSFKLAQSHLPVLLVGYWLSPVEAGYFQLARKTTNLMTIPVGPLTVSSYPEFARLWHRGEIVTLRRLVRHLTLLLSASAAVGLGAMFIGAGPVIRWAVGAEYLPAVPLIYWMAGAMAIAVAANSAAPLLVALGLVRRNLAAMALATAAQLALLIVLLPTVGVAGAGMAYVCFYLVWLLVTGTSVRMAYSTELARPKGGRP